MAATSLSFCRPNVVILYNIRLRHLCLNWCRHNLEPGVCVCHDRSSSILTTYSITCCPNYTPGPASRLPVLLNTRMDSNSNRWRRLDKATRSLQHCNTEVGTIKGIRGDCRVYKTRGGYCGQPSCTMVLSKFFSTVGFILISSNYFPNRSNRSLLCIFALSGTLERELIFKTHRVSSIVVWYET